MMRASWDLTFPDVPAFDGICEAEKQDQALGVRCTRPACSTKEGYAVCATHVKGAVFSWHPPATEYRKRTGKLPAEPRNPNKPRTPAEWDF